MASKQEYELIGEFSNAAAPRRRTAQIKEDAPLLGDNGKKKSRILTPRRLKVFSLCLLIVGALSVAFIIFFPFSRFLSKYLSERFEASDHSTAIIDLDAGRAILHFNGSFRIRNTLPINLMEVALELDYIYHGIEPRYPLAISMDPELLELDTNVSMTVHLDRDFDMRSDRMEMWSKGNTRDRLANKGKRKLLVKAGDGSYVVYSKFKPLVEVNGVEMHTHRKLGSQFGSNADSKLEKEISDTVKALADDFSSSKNGKSDSAKSSSESKAGNDDAASQQKKAAASSFSSSSRSLKSLSNSSDDEKIENTGRKSTLGGNDKHDDEEETDEEEEEDDGIDDDDKIIDENGSEVVADPRFESALAAMHTECENRGSLVFEIYVKFYFHFFFTKWILLREQGFQYTMQCRTTNSYGRSSGAWRHEEY